MTYRQTRLSAVMPWFLLSVSATLGALFAEGQLIPSYALPISLSLAIIAIAAGGHASIRRRIYLEISDTRLVVVGLRPSLWPIKLHHRVEIPWDAIGEVEIGNVGRGLKRGSCELMLISWGSRTATSHDVCLIHYSEANRKRCIFLPHIRDVANFREARAELQRRLPRIVERF